MEISKENIEKIKKFIEIRRKGYYCSGAEVTKVYNEVLHAKLNSTNCSTCISNRIKQLEDTLKRYESEQETLKNNDLDDTPQEENKATVEANASLNKPKRKKK